MTDVYTRYSSPVGLLTLHSDGVSLTGLHWPSSAGAPADPPVGASLDDAPFTEVTRQLDAYFRGDLTEFHLPLQPHGTPFQQRVWLALRDIPYGTTIHYGELARRIGNPNASRAVGAANGKNPISIIVPCHRVIGKDGSLTGFGGGLLAKKALLLHESPTHASYD